MTPRRVVAGRAELADAGVAVRLGQLGAVRLVDQRVVGERRWLASGRAGGPSRICAGVAVGQVLAADDERDRLAEVVDDDARSRRSSCRADRGSAGRRPATRSPAVAPGAGRPRSPRPSPSATRRVTTASSETARSRQPPGQPGPRHGPPCGRRPRRERRARAVAGVDEPVHRAKPLERPPSYGVRIARAGGPDRRPATNPSQSRSSRSAASYAARLRSRSWSSIRSSTRAPAAAARPQTQIALATWPRWR